MATVTETGAGVGIDVRDFKAAVRALRKASPELAQTFRKRLKASGEVVAEKARANAAEHSTTIPATVKVRVRGASVAVIAGGGTNAIARLFELGNTGDHRRATASAGGTFRHPVFGNRRVWATQEMHPFLLPAAEEMLPETQKLVEESLQVVARALELEGLR